MTKSSSIRVLLEQAAVAANRSGLTIIDSEAGPQILTRSIDGSEFYEIWRPDQDDVASFRLAAALHLFRGFHDLFLAEIMGRPNALHEYRMAILRAAAKIGASVVSDPEALPS